MWFRLGLPLALVGALSACLSSEDGSRSCAADGREAAQAVSVDYYHFIHHDGGRFVADLPQPTSPPRLGEVLGKVTCKFDGSLTPVDYSDVREGQAAFLDVGTPYYAVQGCSSDTVIGAMWQGTPLAFYRVPPHTAQDRCPALGPVKPG